MHTSPLWISRGFSLSQSTKLWVPMRCVVLCGLPKHFPLDPKVCNPLGLLICLFHTCVGTLEIGNVFSLVWPMGLSDDLSNSDSIWSRQLTDVQVLSVGVPLKDKGKQRVRALISELAALDQQFEVHSCTMQVFFLWMFGSCITLKN